MLLGFIPCFFAPLSLLPRLYSVISRRPRPIGVVESLPVRSFVRFDSIRFDSIRFDSIRQSGFQNIKFYLLRIKARDDNDDDDNGSFFDDVPPPPGITKNHPLIGRVGGAVAGRRTTLSSREWH